MQLQHASYNIVSKHFSINNQPNHYVFSADYWGVFYLCNFQNKVKDISLSLYRKLMLSILQTSEEVLKSTQQQNEEI